MKTGEVEGRGHSGVTQGSLWGHSGVTQGSLGVKLLPVSQQSEPLQFSFNIHLQRCCWITQTMWRYWIMKVLESEPLVLLLNVMRAKRTRPWFCTTGPETGKQPNLDEDDSLRLQLQTHAVSAVVQEVLQAQELDGAQRPPVPPVHRHLQLPGLDQNQHHNHYWFTAGAAFCSVWRL